MIDYNKCKNSHDYMIIESTAYTAIWYKNIKFAIIYDKNFGKSRQVCGNKTAFFEFIDNTIAYN